ncbi:MAG: TIGR00725 family protein [Thermotogaceae bacterium]|nr:TIGR00725 family protein [Thermotogaceae bacterium]
MRVAVIGYSGDINDEKIKKLKPLCEELGRRIAQEGFTLITGGRDGIMELVSKAAKEAGGTAVGVLPYSPSSVETNMYVDIPIYTGLDFQMRSFIMLYSSEVVISIGGEIGTAIEILGAYAQRKKLIFMKGTGGWTDRFAKVLIDGKYLDNRRLTPVHFAESVDDAIKIIKGMQ